MSSRPFVLRATGLALLVAVAPLTAITTGCYFEPPEVRGSASVDAEIRAGDPAQQYRVTISANAAASAMGNTVALQVVPTASAPCTPGTEITMDVTLRRVDGTMLSRESTVDVCANGGYYVTAFDTVTLETCAASACSTAIDFLVERTDAATDVAWTGTLDFYATIPGSGATDGAELSVQVAAITPTPAL